jgi:hypothetical protein
MCRRVSLAPPGPVQFVMTPMQIDTWNRNRTFDQPFVPGPESPQSAAPLTGAFPKRSHQAGVAVCVCVCVGGGGDVSACACVCACACAVCVCGRDGVRCTLLSSALPDRRFLFEASHHGACQVAKANPSIHSSHHCLARGGAHRPGRLLFRPPRGAAPNRCMSHPPSASPRPPLAILFDTSSIRHQSLRALSPSNDSIVHHPVETRALGLLPTQPTPSPLLRPTFPPSPSPSPSPSPPFCPPSALAPTA